MNLITLGLGGPLLITFGLGSGSGGVSDAQYLAWLAADGKRRVVLVEAQAYVGGSVTTFYLSNLGYVSGPSDTPANTVYDDILVGTPQFVNSMGELFTGQTTPSWGDLDISNENGVRDAWLNYGWDGRSLKLLLGDPDWPRGDFRNILVGATADIYAKDQNVLSLKMRDKQWRLNVPVQTNLIGGTTPNKDLPIPLCYGPCRNIEPVLIDNALHKYQVNDGAVAAIAAVYDNGMSVGFTADLATGTFVLLASPYGRITADVNGIPSGAKGWGEFVYGVDPWGGTYLFTAADLIEHLITNHSTLTSADLDASSFSDFNALCPQALNLYIKDRDNLIAVLDSVITSVGGWYGFSRDGLLQLGVLIEPSTGTSVLDLVADDLVEGDLRCLKRQLPKAVIRLGYSKNWTVMSDGVSGVSGIAGAVTESRRAELSTEYLVATAEDALAIKTINLLALEPDLQGTLLVFEADAIAEAARRLALYGVVREIFQANAFTAAYGVNLGAIVNLTHPRYGFGAGAQAQVVKLTESLTRNRMLLELWR